MENLKNEMAAAAYRHGFTHNYIFGFFNGVDVYAVWMHNVSAEEIAELAYVDRPAPTKTKRGICLRFKGRATAICKMAQKKGLHIEHICRKSEFLAAYNEWNKNQPVRRTRGHYFEYVIAKRNGIDWSYQTDDGRLAPDLWIDGTPWQLKFEGGNFICEDQMLRWA